MRWSRAKLINSGLVYTSFQFESILNAEYRKCKTFLGCQVDNLNLPHFVEPKLLCIFEEIVYALLVDSEIKHLANNLLETWPDIFQLNVVALIDECLHFLALFSLFLFLKPF